MKTKQEVLQEAWGETVYYALDKDMGSWDEPDADNHFYQRWKDTGKVYRNFLTDYSKRFLDRRDDIINLNGWFWPKEIDGIETNNGWTRIESEEDLPTAGMKNYMYCVDGKPSVFVVNLRVLLSLSKDGIISHYMALPSPQAPIY